MNPNSTGDPFLVSNSETKASLLLLGLICVFLFLVGLAYAATDGREQICRLFLGMRSDEEVGMPEIGETNDACKIEE